MHPSALKYGQLFFEKYCGNLQGALVCDIGAQNVNGSLKDVMPEHLRYLGVDFVEGDGVDVILDDPYKLPFEDEKFDAIVCSSCFEHSEFFWLVYLELLRVLKPHGLLYLNVPSNGSFHRYPVDSWRFYPDAGMALQAWGKRSGYRPKLLESFIGARDNVPVDSGGAWHDFVAIFVKEEDRAGLYPLRIISAKSEFINARGAEQGDKILNEQFLSPDHQFSAKLQSEHQAQVVQFQSENQAQAKQLHNAQEMIGSLQNQIQEAQQAIVNLQAQLDQKVGNLKQMNDEIEAMRATLSWRITKPLRWVRKIFS